MEYEDTNILRTQYVNDLVNQRQLMENAMLYQESPVTSGEGFNTMVPKVSALTGAKPSLPYICFRNITLSTLPNVNFNMFHPDSLASCFSGLSTYGTLNTPLDITNINTSETTDFANMFSSSKASSTSYIKINDNLDLSRAVTLHNMFGLSDVTLYQGTYVKTIITGAPTKKWVCKELTDISKFALAQSYELNSPKMLLKNIYNAPIRDISFLLTNTNNVKESDTVLVDILNHIMKYWDLSHVENVDYLFAYGGSYHHFSSMVDFLQSINWSHVTSMRYIFTSDSALRSVVNNQVLDLSMYTFDNIKDCYYAFGIDGFTAVYLGPALNGTVTQTTYMFRSYYANNLLHTVSMGLWDLSSVINCYGMFYNHPKLENVYFGLNLGKGFTTKSNNYGNYQIGLSSSPLLTVESVLFLFNKIYDLNLTYDVANGGKLYTQKIDLHADVIAKLTPEEIAIATNKGWTVA